MDNPKKEEDDMQFGPQGKGLGSTVHLRIGPSVFILLNPGLAKESVRFGLKFRFLLTLVRFEILKSSWSW